MKTADRIKPRAELAALVATARAEGKTVVFTNGVFDFLHAGHLTYLEESRALGDMLVIGLNSDASVKRLKGPERPINGEEDRATMLAGLRCVDYVTIFGEDTAENLLEAIRPSIYTKGGDYDPEKIPETPTVRAHGGEVVIMSFRPGYSNSQQFTRISKAAETKHQRPDFLAGKE